MTDLILYTTEDGQSQIKLPLTARTTKPSSNTDQRNRGFLMTDQK